MAREHSQQRGLAGAVRANKANSFIATDYQVDATE
jgi:hypothetical protein